MSGAQREIDHLRTVEENGALKEEVRELKERLAKLEAFKRDADEGLNSLLEGSFMLEDGSDSVDVEILCASDTPEKVLEQILEEIRPRLDAEPEECYRDDYEKHGVSRYDF